jgi:hypothetical protein
VTTRLNDALSFNVVEEPDNLEKSFFVELRDYYIKVPKKGRQFFMQWS